MRTPQWRLRRLLEFFKPTEPLARLKATPMRNPVYTTSSDNCKAELIGADCAAALGIEAHGSSPVFALCRALIEAGHDPATPLHAYRDKTLALRVRSIGEAAGLEVNGDGTGFRPATKPGRASLVSQNEGARTSPPTGRCGDAVAAGAAVMSTAEYFDTIMAKKSASPSPATVLRGRHDT
jgi:hypothetical protein